MGISSSCVGGTSDLRKVTTVSHAGGGTAILCKKTGSTGTSRIGGSNSGVPMAMRLAKLSRGLFNDAISIRIERGTFANPSNITTAPEIIGTLSSMSVSSNALSIAAADISQCTSCRLVIAPRRSHILSVSGTTTNHTLLIRRMRGAMLSKNTRACVGAP